MRYLLFQVYAPLVSWGEIAVGGERRSHRYPPRSAIIGLMAAALGLRREDEDGQMKLSNSVGIAIKLYSGGTALKDYHTTQVPKSDKKSIYHSRSMELSAGDDKIGTILSNREYRCDSLSVIAVYLRRNGPEFALEKIMGALKKPHFHLYLGRKSCVPALPLAPEIIEAISLKEAFASADPIFPSSISNSAPEWRRKLHEAFPNKVLYEANLSYFWDEEIESGFSVLQTVERYDQPLSRKRWQFSPRNENMSIEKRNGDDNVYQQSDD
jgi:CRISPR system Cascade subunit CasD